MHQMIVYASVGTPKLVSRVTEACELLDVSVTCGSRSTEELQSIASRGACDLLIMDSLPDHALKSSDDEQLRILFIIDPGEIGQFRLPVQYLADFASSDATVDEIKARIRNLLWPGEEVGRSDFVRQGALTLNLATYQVRINGEPVDLTYLEYALLSFLITHPGRTYSRDALLNRVWDFDYYGGSRTVDVHVRRIRAKLGPDLAQHLKTVRGVGYLWSYEQAATRRKR